MSDFTLVIQGKMHDNTLTMANYHKNLPTIISTWTAVAYPSNSVFLEKALRPNLKLIENNLPDPRGLLNDANRYYQFLSTLNGLYQVKTEYVIKVRTDEYYSNLDPVIKKVLATGKTITGDVYFRKTSFSPYHPSDHIVAGKTDLLKKVYYDITSDCIYRAKKELYCPYPETHFARKLISLNEHKPVPKLPAHPAMVKSLMIKYFDLVNSCELGQYFIKSNGMQKQYINSTGYYNIRTDVAFNLEKEL